MRLVIDAMCAEYGGIRTYVQHLLDGWAHHFPEDDVTVLVRRGSTLGTGEFGRREARATPVGTVARPVSQTLVLPRLAHQLSADMVLATAPTTTVRPPGPPLVAVLHDLRHELRPRQFSPARRVLRNVSYGRTFDIASGLLTVSQRSLDDLHRLHPGTQGTPSAVAHHGADHALGWGVPVSRAGPAVAFAHHTNKNPDLLLDAWSELKKQADEVPPLVVCGVSDDLRPGLQEDLRRRGLHGEVTLASYLAEPAFHALFAAARMVVLTSDFEGFGLPIVEGMLLGKPVVIGPDPASLEVSGGHATVMSDWTGAALAVALREARGRSSTDLDDAAAWARTFTWERTVRATRDFLLRVAS
jgi:glycosyltransferase involved in cell wall biosynthesis